MDEELQDLFDEQGGVASVADVSRHLDVSEQSTRRWARTHGVPRVGSAFAFTRGTAEQLAEELESEEADIDDGGHDYEDDRGDFDDED